MVWLHILTGAPASVVVRQARHNERARAALARLDIMDRHTERGGSSCLMEETKLQFEAHERRINAILQDINSLFGSEPAVRGDCSMLRE